MEENTKSENVKWKALKEICKISTGKLNANAKVENGKYPFFTCQKVPNKINKYSFNTEAVLMAGNGNVGNVHYYSGKFDAYQRTYVIESSEVNVKFLYYYLKTFFKGYIENYKKEGIISYITLPVLEKFHVPLPPLKKQEEIAAVLDKFTELTEELTEELTAREAQYDYYRNMLLSQEWIEKEEGKEVEWKALEEIFDTRTGYTPSKKIKSYWENGTVNWFTVENINQKEKNLETANVKISETGVKGELFKGNSVVLSTIASVGEFALIKNDFLINQQFTVFTLKKEYSNFLNMEFVKHYFSQISEYCLKNVRKANIPTVDKSKILKLKFPIPSLKTQKKIVKILDSFETLVNDIKQGLPREIELRQKQYEYYREKLLTF